MIVEELLWELEESTRLLIAALQARDHRFLEYFERRRRALREIESLDPATMPASSLPRLYAAWRGVQMAVARVQRERVETVRRLVLLRLRATAGGGPGRGLGSMVQGAAPEREVVLRKE